MQCKRTSLLTATVLVLTGLGLTATTAPAAVSTDFETGTGYTLAADGDATTTLSTDYAHSASHSAKFNIPDTKADFAKVVLDVAPGNLKLGTTSGTFETYIPASSPEYVPYMYFGVDTNKNGVFDFTGDNTGDSFVIAFFTPTFTANTWLQQGLNSTDIVHIVGNRTGLTSGQYSSTNGGGLLSDLFSINAGSTTWGNLDILQVRVGAGETGGVLNNYVAYVDDINAVPEPTSLALIGLGGLALLGGRRRRKQIEA